MRTLPHFVPLAFVLMGPVIVNILLFRALMAPAGLLPGALAAVLWLAVFLRHRRLRFAHRRLSPPLPLRFPPRRGLSPAGRGRLRWADDAHFFASPPAEGAEERKRAAWERLRAGHFFVHWLCGGQQPDRHLHCQRWPVGPLLGGQMIV